MSLDDLVKRVDPSKKEGHCPRCGTEGVETGRTEIKCPAPRDKCGVLWWYPTSYTSGIEV